MVFAQQQNIIIYCVGERDIVNCLLILQISIFIVHTIMLFQVHP